MFYLNPCLCSCIRFFTPCAGSVLRSVKQLSNHTTFTLTIFHLNICDWSSFRLWFLSEIYYIFTVQRSVTSSGQQVTCIRVVVKNNLKRLGTFNLYAFSRTRTMIHPIFFVIVAGATGSFLSGIYLSTSRCAHIG